MGRKKKNRTKIVKYKKPFNIANLFFGAILVYMIIYLYMFLTSTHVSGYEVIAGSLATNKQFTGLALREEEIFYATTAGYIDYYATESAKVSNATIVYSVDESGRMSQYLQENSDDLNLSSDNYQSLKSDLSSFGNSYRGSDFSKVYDFHNTINGTILELSNQTLLSQMESLSEEVSGSFQRVYAEKSGIVEYTLDGYESITPETLSPQMFDAENYKPQHLRSVDLISAGDPVYKLVTNENWSLIIPMSEDQIQEIAFEEKINADGTAVSKQRSVVEVKFLKDNTTCWGYISILELQGQKYLQLDFRTSMVRFASDRYLDIQIMLENTSGLKIPTSSITSKEFFVIPEKYIVEKNESNGVERGFTVESFDEDGNSTKTFVKPTFYSVVDGMVYVDPNQGSFTSNEAYMKTGDRVILLDTNEVYQIGKTAELEGVYCINQGYTQFRKIRKLYSNEEYTIVEEGTSFGLTIFDRIVLNAEAVEEEQVIY